MLTDARYKRKDAVLDHNPLMPLRQNTVRDILTGKPFPKTMSPREVYPRSPLKSPIPSGQQLMSTIESQDENGYSNSKSNISPEKFFKGRSLLNQKMMTMEAQASPEPVSCQHRLHHLPSFMDKAGLINIMRKNH